MRAFIVRPFSTRQGIDFDRVQRELIEPAMAAAEIVGDTTQQFVEAGNIRLDMFEQLLLANLVIADISIHNANVFYELGIRHALRARQTVLIRARATADRSQRTTEDEVPFDLRTDRYLEYDHQNPKASVDELTNTLASTRDGERADSPVFLSLPSLAEQDQSKFAPVPREFGEEVEEAAAKSDVPHLALLAAEAEGFTWEIGGWRKTGKALFDLGAWGAAERTWERIRDVYPTDVRANVLLGTIFQRRGDVTASDNALDRVFDNPQATRRDLAEAWAQRGRNDKLRWSEGWSSRAEAERQAMALRSQLLSSAYDGYRKAFGLDLNHFYSGLNALSLLTLRLELIRALPSIWSEAFETEEDERGALRALEREHANLAGAVGLSMTSADADEWFAISHADYSFLIARKAALAINAYQAALTSPKIFQSRSARAQLELFASLGLKGDRVAECLNQFPASPSDAPPEPHVVVFTGHRVDEPGRAAPRFPDACAEPARDEIRKRLQELKPTLGLAGAASGGNLLFHQVCGELNIPSSVRLVMPERLFVNHSVAPAGQKWIDQYWALVDAKRKGRALRVLSQSEELPGWLGRKPKYSVWQRANLWMLEEALASEPNRLSVLALWNGEAGDGPGGTDDLLERAKAVGATPAVVDTRKVCGAY